MLTLTRRVLRGNRVVVLFAFLALLLQPVSALPLSLTNVHHHVFRPRESNVFVNRPFSTTMGYVEQPGQNMSHFGYSIPLRDAEPENELMDSIELPHASVRQEPTIYKGGEGGKSRWEIHVVNEPQGMNIEGVMRKCMSIMEQTWESKVLVLMKVTFVDLGDANILARGGGTYFVMMEDVFGDVVIPIAAAEQIRGRDLNGGHNGDGRYDVLVSMNGNSPWYTGVEGNPAGSEYDMVTVLLHEIYHNIVFAGSITATARKDPAAPGGVRQIAELHKGYKTRYDQFLANEDNCAVLGYLNERELANELGVSTSELLANACANGKLYFSYYMEDEDRIARVVQLYAPRIFKRKSSVYHIDFSAGEAHSIMFPTIKRGSKQHRISATIVRMQQIIVNRRKKGAYRRCRSPLANPLPKGGATEEDWEDDKEEDETNYDDDLPPGPREVQKDDVREVGGLPVWAFALLIVFAILLFLLLIGLCLGLLLRRKKRRGFTSVSRSRTTSLPKTVSRTATGTSTGTGTRKSITQYIKPFSSKSRSSSSSSHRTRTTRSKGKSRSESISQSISRSKSTTKKTTTVEETESTDKREVTCPSTGKRVYKCKCYCCCPEQVTRPPPVASVHEYDPDTAICRRKSSHHSDKSKKKCKKVEVCHPGCHCVYCCRYKPSSSRSSKCSKTTTCKSTTSKCTTSKCTTSKCYCEPSSTRCKSSKSSSSNCYCEPSSTRCKTKCKSTTTKCTTRAPPSTKPPTTRVPSTKPPTTKTCKPAASSSKCYKGTGRKCGCGNCQRVVEININNRC